MVYLSNSGEWDSHNDLRNLHARSAARVDKPLAGRVKDLKRKGLDEDVLVACCTAFGRTPGLEARDADKMPTGRGHDPHGSRSGFTGRASSAG